MNNARVTFEVEGVKYSLYFGLVATEIITEKSVKVALSADKSNINIKSLAYIIYGGMCNASELKDEDRPEFEEAYLIAEIIAGDADTCARIQSAWTESKPYDEMMVRLNGVKKKAEAEQNLNE